MRKHVAIPLALLVLPTATFVLFLLDFCTTFYLTRPGPVLSAPQPALLHFCLTHQRMLAGLILVGMGCSLLNAALTVLYSQRCRTSPDVRSQEIEFMGPLLVAFVLSLFLVVAAAWAGTGTSLMNGPGPSSGESLGRLIEHYLLMGGIVAGSLVFTVSTGMLVFLAALFCILELLRHLRGPGPPRIPVVREAEEPELPSGAL